MILSFSGDPFLAARAARRALREQRLGSKDTVELAEGLDAETVKRHVSQGGLFGRVGLLLDFDSAFQGKGGVKPRAEVVDALASATPAETVVAIVDRSATPARQKRYREIGSHEHLPTPRFGALKQWVRGELRDAGLEFTPDVPEVLADLFGEDLPAIASEVGKLAALTEKLDAERVRRIVGRVAARDAFDLIEAVSRGDARAALMVCQSLVAQGEAPARVLGALTWQYGLVARCVALTEGGRRVGDGEAARALGVGPFVAKKALALAARLEEERLRQALAAILRSDQALKSGRNERWALESAALELADLFTRKSPA